MAASKEIDGFYKVMQKTHVVYKTAMVIPMSFYEKHSAQLDQGVQMQHKAGGQVWSGVVAVGPCEGHQIVRGWKRFVEDNNLNISEIVVFKVPADAPREGPLLLKFQVFDAVHGVEKPPVPQSVTGRDSGKRRTKRSVSSARTSSSSTSSPPSRFITLMDSETVSKSSEPTEEDEEV